MRPYLVDFLIEIHQQHRLRPETLYLALNIVDRYVSKRIVFKKHYQLVGCAALWIAAKFEDAKDRVPTVPELCQMCCGAYDESAFIQMEGHVLSTINWVIGHPTTESWLRLACVTGPMEEQRTQHVARFIMEITLFHKEYIPFKPSELALASLLLARFMLGKSRRVSLRLRLGLGASLAPQLTRLPPQILDESEPVLRIAAMLDQHLAEHLDAVSPIVVKKVRSATVLALCAESTILTRRFAPTVLLPLLLSRIHLCPRVVPLRPSLLLLRLVSPHHPGSRPQALSRRTFLGRSRLEQPRHLFIPLRIFLRRLLRRGRRPLRASHAPHAAAAVLDFGPLHRFFGTSREGEPSTTTQEHALVEGSRHAPPRRSTAAQPSKLGDELGIVARRPALQAIG